MKGPPLDGTAAGGIGKDPGGTEAPALQVEGLAATAGPAGSGEDSGWSEPDWALGGNRLVGVTGRKVWATPCHGRSCWCLHPGDQTRLEVAAGP